MLKAEKINVVMNDDKLNLNFNNKKDFLLDDCEEIILYLKNYSENKVFKKIEIDFGKTLFEINDLMKLLIEKSYLDGRKKTQVVLNLGQLDLDNRMKYLRSFNKLNINNYQINYFKK